jgi:hypothetical protein
VTWASRLLSSLSRCISPSRGAVGYGWLLNLVALVHAAQDGVLLNVVILLRVVGLFVVPFGSILGYLV